MEFELYSWKEFEKDAKFIEKELKLYTFYNIYGIPQGGIELAKKLSGILKKPLVDKQNIERKTLVVDDVSDSGETLYNLFRETLFGVCATIHVKPQTMFIPQVFCRKTDKWIVYPWEDFNQAARDFKEYMKKHNNAFK